MKERFSFCLSIFLSLGFLAGCARHEGTIFDAESKKTVTGATIYHNGRATRSDANGRFKLNRVDWGQPLLVKAPGFRQTKILLQENNECSVALQPFDAKAVYLSYYGVGAASLREPVLKLIEETALNALVIDIKGDDGLISFQWSLPLAEEIGAMSRPTIEDVETFITEMHQRNIYVIGRIAVFKDAHLAKHRPEWAITDVRTDKPYAEKDKAAWMDPFRKEVWDYNIALARVAAQAGFDEIQFDYIRFPVTTGPKVAKYSKANTKKNRPEAIEAFLRRAYEELCPSNINIAVDVFGLTCWHEDESEIGQRIRELARWTDYLCPMVYPSGFGKIFPGLSDRPVTIPREVISLSMKSATHFLDGQSKKLRPWLQNFKDYADDKRQFTEREISLQIQGAEEMGASGWLLWDASNRYKYTLGAMKIVENKFQTNVISKTAESLSAYE